MTGTEAATRRSIGRLSRILVAAVLVGCGGTTASPATPDAPQATFKTAATSSAQPTIEPTAQVPSPEASPTVEPTRAVAGRFAPDSIVSVVEGPLRVRSKPSTGDDSKKFEPLLETGQLLFVIEGPERGSDYDWYLVNPMAGPRADVGWGAENDLGWVAAADHDGTPWLESATVSCPAEPSLEELAGMGLKRLHCYGDRAFEFTDTIYWGARCGDPSFLSGPALMADCWSVFYWGEGSSPVELAVPPELTDAVGPREENDIIEATIVAHMDDPAARSCEGSFYETTDFDPFIIELWCRTTFVATSFERISP